MYWMIWCIVHASLALFPSYDVPWAIMKLLWISAKLVIFPQNLAHKFETSRDELYMVGHQFGLSCLNFKIVWKVLPGFFNQNSGPSQTSIFLRIGARIVFFFNWWLHRVATQLPRSQSTKLVGVDGPRNIGLRGTPKNRKQMDPNYFTAQSANPPGVSGSVSQLMKDVLRYSFTFC